MIPYGEDEKRGAYEAVKNRNEMFKKLIGQIDATLPDVIGFTILIPTKSSQSETVCVTSNASEILRRIPGQESILDKFCRELVAAKEGTRGAFSDRIFAWKIPYPLTDEYAQKWLELIISNQLRSACRRLHKIEYNGVTYPNYPFKGKSTFPMDQMRYYVWQCLIFRSVNHSY